MSRRLHAAGLLASACCLALCVQPVTAQTSPRQGTNPPPTYSPTSLQPDDPFSIPRTRDGRPDFQGAVWEANHAAYLQAGVANTPLTIAEDKQKAAFDRMLAPFLNNPEFKIQPDGAQYIFDMDGLPKVRGERRTRLLVLPADGKLPLTEAARKELATPDMAAFTRAKSHDPEDRPITERCLVSADLPPFANMFLPSTRSFIQTPAHLVMHLEYGDEARIIPLGAAPVKTTASSYGDTAAHWDGDTLVIETTNLPQWQRRRFLPAYIINTDAKVIERYTLLSKDELLYQFTVEDPKIYSAPWLAEYSLHRSPFRMYSSECHEANYSLPNILRGQRVADEKAAKPKL
jgi:hypothetical protein